MDLFKLSQIIKQYLRNETTEEEQQLLEDWMNLSSENENFVHGLSNEDNIAKELKNFQKFDSNKAWDTFHKNHIQKKRNRSIIWTVTRVAAAAAIILTLSGGLYLFLHNNKPSLISKEAIIQPGNTHAIFHVAQQAPLILSDTLNTTVTADHKLMARVEGGKISYGSEMKESVPMEVEVPLRSEYTFELADGTTVWMNAGSKVKFNYPFEGNTREIEVEGEVFLKVAKDKTRPFIVHLPNDNAVQVLGTEFNVNAYPNSLQQQTVLVEGSILWRTHKGTERILEPGQLLSMNQSDNEITVQDVATSPYTAWKDGRFVFESAELENIMTTLSRWYGFEVSFQHESLKSLHFSADVRRYDNLNSILELLKLTGKVDFEITKDKVFIKQKS